MYCHIHLTMCSTFFSHIHIHKCGSLSKGENHVSEKAGPCTQKFCTIITSHHADGLMYAGTH